MSPPVTGKKSAGLAITVILLAVLLLTSIAITIALSNRSNNANSNQQQDKLLATTLLEAAQQLKNNVDLAVSNGLDPATIYRTSSGQMTSFWSGSQFITSISVPVNATTDPQTWYWHGANAPIIIKDIGTSAGSYLVELVHLTQSVCQQIDLGLFNSTAIPVVSTTGWDDTPIGDTTNDPALDDQTEGCFYYAPSPEYFYYKVIVIR